MVGRAFGNEMRAVAYGAADRNEQFDQHPNGVGFGMWRDGADNIAREPIKRRVIEFRPKPLV